MIYAISVKTHKLATEPKRYNILPDFSLTTDIFSAVRQFNANANFIAAHPTAEIPFDILFHMLFTTYG